MPLITAVTCATYKGLVTLSTMKEELNITGNNNDGKIKRYINEVSNYICFVCGVAEAQNNTRTFGKEVVQYIYDRSEIDKIIVLPHRIPTNIIGVVEDGRIMETTEYQLEGNMLYKLDCNLDKTTWSSVKIIVNCNVGWDLAEEEHPPELQRAAIEMVRIRYQANETTRDPLLKSMKVPGVIEQEYWVGAPVGETIPPDIRELLQPFTRLSVA